VILTLPVDLSKLHPDPLILFFEPFLNSAAAGINRETETVRQQRWNKGFSRRMTKTCVLEARLFTHCHFQWGAKKSGHFDRKEVNVVITFDDRVLPFEDYLPGQNHEVSVYLNLFRQVQHAGHLHSL